MSASLANNYVEHVPPLPLIPYAVSLSLTVAYRLLRDKSPSTDVQQAKHDLEIRCEILEGLRKEWWSADAMAKLGRRALASLKPPSQGETRMGDDVVGSLIEQHVAECRYGPLTGKQMRTAHGDPTGIIMDGQGSNALDVLSSAAVSLGESIAIATTPSTSTSTYPPPEEIGEMALPLSSFGTGIGYGGVGVGVADQFQDLDSLFFDFFDLSMPTLFEDPLFEGAAFGEFA